MIKVHHVYLFIAFLLDCLLAVILPYDFSLQNFNFTPAFSLIALIIMVKDYDLWDNLAQAWLIGLIYSLIFADNYFIYPLTYAAVILVSKIYSSYITYSMIEYILLGAGMVALKEFLLFFLYTGFSLKVIPLTIWFQKQFFITIIGNIPVIYLMLKLYKPLTRYFATKS